MEEDKGAEEGGDKVEVDKGGGEEAFKKIE